MRISRGGVRRASRVLLVATATCAVVPLTAAHAADPVSQAESALRSQSLYVDPGAEGFTIKQDAVRGSIPAGVKIAVLPANGDSPSTLAVKIGQTLDPDARGLTVGVLTVSTAGYELGAASSAFCEGYAGEKAKAAVAANRDELRSTKDITPLLQDFASSVTSGPKSGSSDCDQGGGAPPAASKSDDGRGSAWAWIIGIAVVGAGGVGGLAWYRRRQKKCELKVARAKVMPYYDRLASEVNTLDPKDNDTALRAIADASERYASAGTQLDTADSVEKYAQARRTTLEGLHAAVAARKALGLDKGPPLPSMDGARSDQLTDEQEVTVQGKTYQGYPSYQPGAPYYYGGGYGVPGGWYATPFWETLLIGSMLTGGFGGWGGGGYGSGYDSGYQSGYDAGQDANDSGGDWGGGGGDWGGGGGDWGGGGGDWGGGGGDAGGSW